MRLGTVRDGRGGSRAAGDGRVRTVFGGDRAERDGGSVTSVRWN